eukprot:15366401-Ditylum_brightwellii.AAC.1
MESISGEETLQLKCACERVAATHGVHVKWYHLDNGRISEKYTSPEWNCREFNYAFDFEILYHTTSCKVTLAGIQYYHVMAIYT